MSKLKFKMAGLTDQGKVRTNNEDAVWVDPQMGLLIVADGMGGHQSGEKASGIAVTSIPENLRMLTKANTIGETVNKSLSPESNRLAFCVKLANHMIFEASKNYPKDRGMGTTCTAALIHDRRVAVAHVGDSRCYLLRRGELEQLTQDHSLVMDQVRQGLISKDDAARSALQNILTRALGTQEEVQVDIEEHPLLPGDLLLLCSDGLSKEMTDEEVRRMVLEGGEPKAIAEKLIERCNTSGGRDNITIAVAVVEKQAGGLAGSLKRFFKL